MSSRDRLRIAIQKSGRIGGPARELLQRIGMELPTADAGLVCPVEGMPVDLLQVRDDDIPGLLEQGLADFGIVGRNVLREYQLARTTGLELQELRPLGFSSCRLSIAVPEGFDYREPSQLDGLRIATSYPALLGEWLEANGVSAEIVVLAGSVEIAPSLGQADAVCDLVSSGGTLRANRLVEVETVMRSEAVLAVSSAGLPESLRNIGERVRNRIVATQSIREGRLLMFNAARGDLPGLLSMIPEAATPTVSSIEDGTGAVAIKALCANVPSWQQMERMRSAGARELMVVPLERMLP